MFDQAKSAVVKSCKDIHEYFKVPRKNNRDLDKDPEIKDYIEDLAAWDSCPPNFDPDAWWILDPAVQYLGPAVMKKLGKGIGKIEFSIALEKRHKEKTGGGSLALKDAGVPAPSGDKTVGQPPSIQDESVPPRARRQRQRPD